MNDANLLSASSAILQTPINIATLAQQKVEAIAGKASALVEDDTNKIFYDNEKSYLKAYFDEEKFINGVVHTEYSDTDLDNSGRLAPGNLHYPAPAWVKFPPKVISSNTGAPISSVADFESVRLTSSQGSIAFLKTGFSDGVITETLVNPHVVGGTIDTANSFVIGNRLVINDGVNTVYGTVTGIVLIPPVTIPVPAPAYYEHTLTFVLDASLTISGVANNFHPGWTDLDRKELPTPIDVDFMNSVKASCDAEILALKGFLDNELIALNSNASTGTEATEILAAKTAVQNTINSIVAWQLLPSTTVTSRFGDTNLNNLSADFTTRSGLLSTRVSQITAAIGALSQDGEGAFTGTGHFLSLFKWIDLRINITYGSLRNFYNWDLIISFIDSKILGENNKKTEYEKIMVVKRIVSEITGNDELTLTDVTDLSISDAVKILDEDSPSLAVTILNITGNVVQLSSNIPVSYTVDKQARLIKEL